jgi:hypothetical protein
MDKISNPEKKAQRRGSLPRTDIDLGAVATQVALKWAENDWLTLQWLSPAQFQAAVSQYTAELSERMQAGATRPALTAAIKELSNELDGSVRFVKAYLFEKYGDAAKDHYHAFGLVRVGASSMILPRDQNQKAEALAITLQAIVSEGFEEKPYGKTYWQEKANAYNALLLQAKTVDGSVASKVGHKNEYRNTVVRGLNSIILALRAHYPDTGDTEIRSWGFQKEKY